MDNAPAADPRSSDEMVNQVFPNWPLEYMRLQAHCQRVDQERQALLQMNQALHHQIEHLQKKPQPVLESWEGPARGPAHGSVSVETTAGHVPLRRRAAVPAHEQVVEGLLHALCAEVQQVRSVVARLEGHLVPSQMEDGHGSS